MKNIMVKLRIVLPREKIAAFCRKWKVREFSVFGSVLRDDFRPDSGIDVMVDFEPDARRSLWDSVSMTDELKVIFGRGAILSSTEVVHNVA